MVIKRSPRKFVQDGVPSAYPSGGTRSGNRVGLIESIFDCPSERGRKTRACESKVGIGGGRGDGQQSKVCESRGHNEPAGRMRCGPMQA